MNGIASVVIPAFNHGKYILSTIESVLSQTCSNYEIIVVDDGSSDDTARVLFPLIHSGKIRYVYQENCGQSAARNKGFSLSCGEFVAFLDDDDCWPTDKLEWQIAELQRNPDACLVYGFMEVLNGGPVSRSPSNGGPSGMVFDQFVANGWIRSPGQTLIRRSSLSEIGGFDTQLWGTDDWDLYLRLSKVGQFIYRDRISLYYRQHESNASLNFERMYANGMKVIDKHFPLDRADTLYFRSASIKFVRNFCVQYGTIAAIQSSAGSDRSIARKVWYRLLRLEPKLILRRFVLRYVIWLHLPSSIIKLRRKILGWLSVFSFYL